MTCCVYKRKHYKVLRIVCCDMQFEDGAAHTFIWKKLECAMGDNGVTNTIFKGFMIDIAQANSNVVPKIYNMWRSDYFNGKS